MTNNQNEFRSLIQKGIIKLSDKCVNCNSNIELQLHHIVPLGAGGTNNLGNIVTLCNKCYGTVNGESSSNNANILLKKSKIKKVENGDKSSGNAPIGYKWNNARIIVDTDKAYIVKEIFSLALKGLSSQKIADAINNKGYTTDRGNKFSKQAVHLILTNDFYIGIVTHGSIKKEGNHKALISKVTFGKVQSALKKRRKIA